LSYPEHKQTDRQRERQTHLHTNTHNNKVFGEREKAKKWCATQ